MFEPSFTVHNFAPTSLQRANSPLSQSSLVSRGHELIVSATRPFGWKSVVPSPCFAAPGSSKAYTFSTRPPAVQERHQPPVLKEWGTVASANDADYFRTAALDDFQGTDFAYLAIYKPQTLARGRSSVSEVRCSLGSRKSVSSERESETSKKRKGLGSSSYQLIHEPHCHLHPPSIPPPPDGGALKHIQAYTRSPMVPIPPYTFQSMLDYLGDRYARSAWVIPIRGSLPWGSSGSVVSLRSSYDIAGGATKNEIQWTHSLLDKFWDYLLTLRQSQALGALSLTYHVASTLPSAPKGLLSCDHIKVFHDSIYAMHMRNLLDGWKYDESGSVEETGRDEGTGRCARVKKVRMRPLDGVKLVLVDEAGDGVLTC